MGRPVNPGRRAELLSQIIVAEAGTSLDRMTFRKVAADLGVSTYPLVYHFGNRSGLVQAVLEETLRMHREVLPAEKLTALSRERFESWVLDAFTQTVGDRFAAGTRLQFEAAALETIDPDVGTFVGDAYRAWLTLIAEWFSAQGIAPGRAEMFAQVLVNSAYGAQFASLVSRDEAEAVAAFRLFLGHFMDAALGVD